MANVSLGTIRDYLKGVYDAVALGDAAKKTTGLQIAGTDGTNAQIIRTNANGEATVQLSGRNVEVTTLLNAVEVRDGTGFSSVLATTAINADIMKKYKDFNIRFINTHDKSCRIAFTVSGGVHYAKKDGSIIYCTTNADNGAYHKLPGNAAYIYLSSLPAVTGASGTLIDLSEHNQWRNFKGTSFILWLRFQEQPTKGSISAWLEGVPN